MNNICIGIRDKGRKIYLRFMFKNFIYVKYEMYVLILKEWNKKKKRMY